MNNLQQFLEEEQEDVTKKMCDDVEGEHLIVPFDFIGRIKDHDTRLINKVLDEVKKEVEELNKLSLCGKCEISTKNELSHTQLCNYKKKISTLLENLKVK